MGNRLLTFALCLAFGAVTCRTLRAEYETESARAASAASALGNSANPYNAVTQPAQFMLYQAQKSAARNSAQANQKDGQTVRQDDPQLGSQAKMESLSRKRATGQKQQPAPAAEPTPDPALSLPDSPPAKSSQSQSQSQSSQSSQATSSPDILKDTSGASASLEVTVGDRIQGGKAGSGGAKFDPSDPLAYAMDPRSRPPTDPSAADPSLQNPYKVPSMKGGSGFAGSGAETMTAVVESTSDGKSVISKIAGKTGHGHGDGTGSSGGTNADGSSPGTPITTLSIQSSSNSSGGTASGQSTVSQ